MTLLSEIAGRRMRLTAPQSRDVIVERDLRVPTHDGTTLLADRWAPPQTTRAPTVLVRSPYGRTGAFGFLFGRLLAERGLQVVIQSVSGTFGSEGEFDPMDEREDGLATLRWLEQQPWHDGRVGTIGPSYVGFVQWAIADEVDALAPSVTASQFFGMAYGSGSLSLDTALSWMLIIDVQERRLAPFAMLHGLRRTLPELFEHLPLGDLDEAAFGAEVPYFREWLKNLDETAPYWQRRDFSGRVGDVTAPVQLTGGFYDIFLPWMVRDYRALRDAGRSPQLILGPWTHTSGALMAASLREGIAWLRAHLLGDERKVRDTPVRAYVTGWDRWLDLADWPPPEATPRTLYLQPGGELGDEPVEGEPTRFRYDPNDPTPAVGGPVLLEREPVRDNRALEARDDVVTFTGAALEDELVALGPVTASIRLRSSAPDTDVFVRLCDVHPDGRSMNVCDALRRVKGADALQTVELELWPAAHAFAAGHRLRVQVSSGAHPRYARNPGSGEDPVSATTLVVADQEVHHPSSVTITVL